MLSSDQVDVAYIVILNVEKLEGLLHCLKMTDITKKMIGIDRIILHLSSTYVTFNGKCLFYRLIAMALRD